MHLRLRTRSLTAAFLGFVFSALIQAQGLPVGAGFGGLVPGVGAEDLNSFRGAAPGSGAAAGLSAGAGLGNLFGGGGILLPMFRTDEDDTDSVAQADKDKDKVKAAVVLPPNDFQKYVLEVTGNAYPLYGADFFENQRNAGTKIERSPATSDYLLGAGDQLLIRTWGSVNTEIKATLDRSGEIAIPKFGTVKLAGVKASHAEGIIRSVFARLYKDFEISVSLGKLRKITVYVVGQSRAPGSYTLSSQSTLTSGIFASGGPNGSGSVRRVQLKRQDVTVSEFDLYNFISKGDKSADVKLQDGDVIFFPPAIGYMAIVGKVNNPGIYEVKGATETVADVLNLAGGLPIVADPRRATLDRVTPDSDQPRRIQGFSLDAMGLRRQVNSGDIISVAAIVPELANSISLRGNVTQPTRLAWRSGMRISDIISRKSLLISPDSVRRQNEVLFDTFEQERSARFRARIPQDLANERQMAQMSQARGGLPSPQAPGQQPAADASSTGSGGLRHEFKQDSEQRNSKPSFVSEEGLVDRIGGLVEEVNLDYAVVERIHREDLRIAVIPFNLGRVLANASDPDNLLLEPGDVLTVFSVKDLRVPVAKRRAFVRIEGEVQRPGVYTVLPGENLVHLVKKAGGITPDAYLYGMSLYREDVKKNQQENLRKILRQVEMESMGALSQASQSTGASSDAASLQSKIQSLQQARRQAIERMQSLQPEGRIALGIPPQLQADLGSVPQLRLSHGDRIFIPARPDFVYVLGSVNTEAALIYKPGRTVGEYLQLAGSGSAADRDGVILVRADASALTNQSSWTNEVLATQVMPGDTIVLPEKLDRESVWSSVVRNTKDFTQIMYQLGLGAAAIKTLRQ